jgi:hypothetical protein
MVLRTVLKLINEEHKLRRVELDMLLAAGKSLKPYLPSLSEIRKGEAATVVTKYAGKNSAEFYAESFACYYSGVADLPDAIDCLMKDTLKRLQASR